LIAGADHHHVSEPAQPDLSLIPGLIKPLYATDVEELRVNRTLIKAEQ
jgi:hypothetical protein